MAKKTRGNKPGSRPRRANSPGEAGAPRSKATPPAAMPPPVAGSVGQPLDPGISESGLPLDRSAPAGSLSRDPLGTSEVPTDSVPASSVPGAATSARSAPPSPKPSPGGVQPHRVARVTPAGARAAGARPRGQNAATAALFEPLDSDDAAIPFDRVPYVPADLRRVAIIASLMVAVIVIADIIVNRLVNL